MVPEVNRQDCMIESSRFNRLLDIKRRAHYTGSQRHAVEETLKGNLKYAINKISSMHRLSLVQQPDQNNTDGLLK